MKYIYLAACALDSWAFEDVARSQSFDIGYVHPDKEQHAYAALKRGDGSRIIDLLSAYATSWSRLPAISVERL